MVVFGVPMALGIAMSLVDSYRRRGKKPKPFPTTPPQRRSRSATATITTYTFGSDLYADMLAAIEGAQRQILFETYIWKGDEVGERFKSALAAAADRGVEVYCIYDGFANLVVVPAVQALPADDEGAALPGLRRGMALLRPAPLRPRPPQDPGGRRRGGLRRRLQHRLGRTRPSGATPTSGSPVPACRTSGARSPTSGTCTGGAGSGPASDRCCSRRPASGSRRSGSSATCRGCGCSPSAACTSRRSTGRARNVWMTHAYFIPDQDFVDALNAAARRGVDVRLLVPLKSNHIVADWISPRLLRPAARGRRADLPLQGRDGARQDLDRGRQLVDGRHREHRPAQPPGQLRDQRRGDRPGWRGPSRRSGRSTSPTASS